MAAATQLDFSALLESFLLTRYVKILQDESRSSEERLEWQMALESFVLVHGKQMLTQISRLLAATDISADTFAAISWYSSFASSLEAEWLDEVDNDLLERAWRGYNNHTYRRCALELMVKKEWISDRTGNNARESRVVRLFQELQNNRPIGEGILPEAKELVELLLRRANLTDPNTLRAGGSLGNYCLQIARFCLDYTSTSISEENITMVLALCPEFDETHRVAVAEILRLTRIAPR